MNQTLKNQIEKSLALTFSSFKNEAEALSFLKEFLTPKEVEMLSKRLAVAYWLTKKRNYLNIQNNLKVSSATIAEARRQIQLSTIKKAIKKLDADEWADKWENRILKFVKK